MAAFIDKIKKGFGSYSTLTFADTGSRVTTWRASALLEMKTPPPAPNAKRMCLVPPLSETPSSLTLLSPKKKSNKQKTTILQSSKITVLITMDYRKKNEACSVLVITRRRRGTIKICEWTLIWYHLIFISIYFYFIYFSAIGPSILTFSGFKAQHKY